MCLTLFLTVPKLIGMATTSIEVNGFAIREIRIILGVDMDELAERVDVKRPYINKIELGHSPRVSPKVFASLMKALGLRDRRAILANPHLEDMAGAA